RDDGRRVRGVHRPRAGRSDLPPPAADRRRRDARAARLMSTATWAWLVLAFPLAGMLIVAFGYRALWGRGAGWIATGAILLSFGASIGALVSLQRNGPAHRQIVSTLYQYASSVGVNADMSILVDPLSVFLI